MSDWTRRTRRRVRRIVESLPAPRGDAAVLLLRTFRDLVTGRHPLVPEPRFEAFGPQPGPRLPDVEPLSEDQHWPTPPAFTTGDVLHRLHEPTESVSYGVELLEALNREYAHKPLVPAPRSYSPDAMLSAARRRVRWAHNHVDLREKKVLEIGCGNGVEVWTMANALGCDAHGVDVLRLGSWDAFSGDRCKYSCVDLAVENPFPADSFDRVVSYTVWEHVMHPHRMLEETYRVLKPGGLAWIRANLYAGPKASHRYRDIYFPWPHLLFSDATVREWDVWHGRAPKGLSWVNRLSMHHYRNYFVDVGFNVRRLSVQETPIDEEFYARFEDVLGRFPLTDLRQDFFLAVLEKPARASRKAPYRAR